MTTERVIHITREVTWAVYDAIWSDGERLGDLGPTDAWILAERLLEAAALASESERSLVQNTQTEDRVQEKKEKCKPVTLYSLCSNDQFVLNGK